MALDLSTSGAATTSASATDTPSTTLSAVSTTASSSLFTSPSANGAKSGYHGHLRPTATTFGPLAPRHNLDSSLTTKDIVLHLRQLAQDPHQQIHLIDNTESLCILSDSLLDTTTLPAIEKCIIALQTLQLLAANPKYRDTLRSVPSLSARVETLCLSAQQRIAVSAKSLRTALHSKSPLLKSQQFQPRPLHKVEFTISNLNTETDRDEIQTIGIKMNHIISVTVNMSSRTATFYATREGLRKSIALRLRSNGFQCHSDGGGDLDDVASVHSGVSNFVDDQSRAQLSSLQLGPRSSSLSKSVSGQRPSNTSIIQERYGDENEAKGGDAETMSKNGITRYRAKHHVESLAQRLQKEQMVREENAKKQQHTQSYLAKIISYVW